MSSSDAVGVDELRRMTEAVWAAAGSEQRLPDEEIKALVNAVTKLYSQQVALRRSEIGLGHPAINPTDLVVLACALLRAGDLNPFDLAIWFGRVATD